MKHSLLLSVGSCFCTEDNVVRIEFSVLLLMNHFITSVFPLSVSYIVLSTPNVSDCLSLERSLLLDSVRSTRERGQSYIIVPVCSGQVVPFPLNWKSFRK